MELREVLLEYGVNPRVDVLVGIISWQLSGFRVPVSETRVLDSFREQSLLHFEIREPIECFDDYKQSELPVDSYVVP